MAKTFECPACGAPLDYEGADATMRCPYCHNSVIVPEELLSDHQPENVPEASPRITTPDLGIDNLKRLKEVKALIEAGKKIEAIKLFREITGVGLREAKQAVDDLEAGVPVEITSFSSTAHTASSTPYGASPEKAAGLGKVAHLTQDGKKIEAIKLYREIFDVSLLEAKTAVEKIQAGKFDEVAQMALASSYIPQVFPPAVESKISKTVLAGSAATAAGGGSCLILTISVILLVTIVPILIAMASNGGPLSEAWSRVNPFAFARLSLSFGGEGTGPGRFTDVRNITVDNHSNNIYVTELKGGRVQVFNSEGKYISQWDAGDGKMYISSIAADRMGNVYLAINGELKRYNGANGAFLGKLAYEDGNNFDYVATSVDGGLVAFWDEFNDNLVRFDKNGNIVWVTQNAISSVNEDNELERRVAIDGSGNVFILGSFTNAVYKFSPTGKYIDRWGGEGDGKGQFFFPDAIAVDTRSRVYVSDGKGVQVFDADGRYLALIPVQGAVFSMAVTDNDELWVITNKQKVMKYNIVK
jgi:ribosomal protein L7/L12/streptogramin lyase/DNA-directed RNA polymerase subunit RPC12/RpoP